MMEAAALGKVVEPVGATADDHLALVGLRHIAVHGVGHDNHIHARLDRLADQRLQRDRFNRQTEARHFGQLPGMTGNHHAQFVAADKPFRGFNALHHAAFRAHGGDFGLLDDVHPHGRTGPRITPSHSIVPPRAAARLIKRAEDRIARTVDVDDWHQLFHLGRADVFGLHALQQVGMHRAQIAAHLMMGLRQHQKPARAEHDVVVQILAQVFVKLQRLVIDRGRRVLQIVRPDDRGVAPGVATAQPTLFDDRHVLDAVVLAQIIGCGQTMTARANDDDIIVLFRLWRGPSPLPAQMMGHRLFGDGKDRITFHGRPLCVLVACPTDDRKNPSYQRHNRENCDMMAPM